MQKTSYNDNALGHRVRIAVRDEHGDIYWHITFATLEGFMNFFERITRMGFTSEVPAALRTKDDFNLILRPRV